MPLRCINADDLKVGMVIALPFDKRATITSVKVGRKFVSLTYAEYHPTRVERGQEMTITD